MPKPDKKSEEKKPYFIPKISKKESARLRKYSVVRKEYLAEHPFCEVKGCRERATENHHKRGKIGSLLCDKRYFFATCSDHHRFIEVHPEWAKENGYSENRLSK